MKEIIEKVIKNIETTAKEKKNITCIIDSNKQDYEIIREFTLRKNKYQKLQEPINILFSARFSNSDKSYYKIQ